MNILQRLFVVVLLAAPFTFSQTNELIDAPKANIAEPTLLASNAAVDADVTSPAAGGLLINAAAMAPSAPAKPRLTARQEEEVFYSLMTAEHGAALLDAWSTRDVLRAGGRELDPIVRPFAHSPALYAALQVAPFAVDYFAARMMRSNHRLLRAMWWVPQLISAGGSVYCGVANLGNRP